MISIIVDTFVWLNLAKEPSYYDIIEAIKEILDSNQFQLVLPSVLTTEFKRNREQLESAWKSQIKGYLTNLRNLCKILPSKKIELCEFIEETQKLVASGGEGIRKNLELIDRIFNDAILFEVTDAMMIEASHRCINHIAPATIPQRSSIGDCLIWLTVLEKLKEGEVWFCTDNKKDFSAKKKARQDIPDELLDSEAFSLNAKGCFNYFIEPIKLVEIAQIKLEIHAQRTLPVYQSYNPLELLFKHSVYKCSNCGSSNTSWDIRTVPQGWMKFVRCHDCNTVNLVDMVEAIE